MYVFVHTAIYNIDGIISRVNMNDNSVRDATRVLVTHIAFEDTQTIWVVHVSRFSAIKQSLGR